MHLHCPTQPELAWGLTYLPDPKATICVGREVSSDMLNESLQDPRQLTALLGLKKDKYATCKYAKPITPLVVFILFVLLCVCALLFVFDDRMT